MLGSLRDFFTRQLSVALDADFSPRFLYCFFSEDEEEKILWFLICVKDKDAGSERVRWQGQSPNPDGEALEKLVLSQQVLRVTVKPYKRLPKISTPTPNGVGKS